MHLQSRQVGLGVGVGLRGGVRALSEPAAPLATAWMSKDTRTLGAVSRTATGSE